MSTSFSRRRFITGTSTLLAGTGLLSLLGDRALAETQGPKRVVFWYAVEGTVGQAFWPGHGPGAFSINPMAVMGDSPQSRRETIDSYRSMDRGTWILGPMKDHEADMTLVSGLTTQMGSADDDHARAVDAVLAGGMPSQGSIDQAIGEHLQGGAPFHAVYSSLMGEHIGQNLANYAGPIHTLSGNVVAPTWNPVTTYNQVFPTGIGEDPTGPNYMLESRLDVVGSVRAKLRDIHQRGGVAARERLESYLESIESIENQTNGLLEGHMNVDVEVDIPPEWVDIDPDQKYWRHSPNFGPLGKIMMDTTIAALATDRTRVATMHWSASGRNSGVADGTHYSTLGLDLEGDAVQDHMLAHDNDDRKRRNQCRIFRWYYEQLAYFVDRLKSIPEGDGTLFDNTVVVVCSEFGGYNHNFNDVPLVLVGSAGGALKTGQYFDVHNGGFRRYGDALLAVAKAVGLELGSNGHANDSFDELLT